jgi:hypothetical protein
MTDVTGPKTGLAFTGETHPIRVNGFPATGRDLPGEALAAPPPAGTAVWVNAFGAWRQGAVVRPGRRRCQVEYVRSRTLTLAEKSAPLYSIRRR